MGSQILRGIAVEPVEWELLGGPARPPWAERDRHSVPGSTADPEIDRLRARLAEAERDAVSREQRARAAGYAEGEAAGRAAESARVDDAVARLAGLATELAASRRKLRRDAEEDCVRLAIAIARRVLRRELVLDPDALLGIVKAALSRLEGRELDRIRLHPRDAALIGESLRDMPGSLNVVADPSLESGACIIETVRGSLDASVETQLLEIERGLVDRIR